MRLGFQSPSPLERIKHHRYGDDGWQVIVRRRGDMWLYSTLHARAHFGPDSAPAELFVDHPGEIAVFARLHLALVPDGFDRLVLDSGRVRELIGDGGEGRLSATLAGTVAAL